MPEMSGRNATYPSPTSRAAVVQLEAVHEECLPALVHLLRRNAVEPVVFLNARIRQLRPGLRPRFPELSDVITFVPVEARDDWTRLAQRVVGIDPDLVVLNTFQNPGPVGWTAEWAPRWRRPILGVVHNADYLEQPARELIASGQVQLLTLGRHVSANLMARDPLLYGRTATITSVFPRPPRVRPAGSQHLTVAIPGRVMFDFRDYHQVVDALPAMMDALDPASFRICVVGGGDDRGALQDLVTVRGVADQFLFVPLNEEGFVSGRDYYAHLRAADFMLPLVPPTDPAYRSHKITSAVPTALGLVVPPILDRWTASVYDVPAVAYPGADVGGALMRALTMTDEERADLRRRVREARDRDLDRAESELRYALDNVGVVS